MSRAEKPFLILPFFAALLLCARICGATNPCDVSEKACDEWKKAQSEQAAKAAEALKPAPSVIPARACDADPSYCAQYQKSESAQPGFGSSAQVKETLKQGLPKQMGQGMAQGDPQVAACEAAIGQPQYGRNLFRDAKGQPFMGFDAPGYSQSGDVVNSLVLLTDEAAYYYSEPCDICADVAKCDLKTRQVTNVLHEHSLGCSDMARFAKGNVAYDACAKAQKPDLAACEAAIGQPRYGRNLFRDAKGQPFKGFDVAGYSQSGDVVNSLVLLTDEAAYYYSESCDICADVAKCDLKTHQVSNVLHEHSLGCSDLAPLAKGDVAFSACPAR